MKNPDYLVEAVEDFEKERDAQVIVNYLNKVNRNNKMSFNFVRVTDNKFLVLRITAN